MSICSLCNKEGDDYSSRWFEFHDLRSADDPNSFLNPDLLLEQETDDFWANRSIEIQNPCSVHLKCAIDWFNRTLEYPYSCPSCKQRPNVEVSEKVSDEKMAELGRLANPCVDYSALHASSWPNGSPFSDGFDRWVNESALPLPQNDTAHLPNNDE